MKKLLAPLSAFTFAASYQLNSALAVGSTNFFQQGTEAPGAGITAVSSQGFVTAVQSVINYFLGILGLIAVGFLIYAGILMVTSGGEEEGVTKARKIITYAAIGIVVIVLSYTIVQFVSNVLQQ